MSESVSTKVKLLTKRIQDRKTAEIFHDNYSETMSLEEVQDILELSECQQAILNGDIIITLLITMKSIAHTTQTSVRWQDFMKRCGGSNSIYTFSSKGDYTSVSQITDKLTCKNPPRHIVMCMHPKRIRDIITIAKFLDERNEEMKRARYLRIYADELDKYIDDMHTDFNTILGYNCVMNLTAITATPGPIYNYWPHMNMFDLTASGGNKPLETYLMFSDCEHIVIDNLADSMVEYESEIEYAEDRKIIQTHRQIVAQYPNITEKGRVIFAPANMSRRSHDIVAKFWNYQGCAVIIINGERTSFGFYGYLYLPNNSGVIDIPHMTLGDFESKEMKQHVKNEYKDLPLSTNAQLNDIISDIFVSKKLYNYPLVITGLICIQRAQSLVHPVWGTFTDVINANKPSSPEDAYQQQRQLGHIKAWSSYRGIPRVFSTNQVRQDIEILERRALNFSAKKYENGTTVHDYTQGGKKKEGDEIPFTSRELYKKAREERKRIVSCIQIHSCKTLEEVNVFLKNTVKLTQRNLHCFETINGYVISTRLTSINKKKKEALTAEDRITEEKLARIPLGLNISSKSGQQYMVYPVYPTMTSPPSELSYHIRYLENKKE